MFCPLPRASIVQSHADDESASRRRLLPTPNAARTHHHNFRSAATRKEQIRREDKTWKPFRNDSVQREVYSISVTPRHRWATEDAQRELPLPLPHRLLRRSYGNASAERRERDARKRLSRRERGTTKPPCGLRRHNHG